MNDSEEPEPPTPSQGDTRFGPDGELLYWDGSRWLPYQRLVDAMGAMFQFRDADSEAEDL
ncbi:hypothetical protein ABZ078_12980 [Streptomyces sp. NPDC006385]|uniref:hypothetical protein n=1 Tax=Streptomyces sp. NPDC006385 TaxID=3156761 RepID=UPI0033B9E25D